jgi:hypothetical protein
VDRSHEEELHPAVGGSRSKSSVTENLLADATPAAAEDGHAVDTSDTHRRSTRTRKAPEKFADSSDYTAGLSADEEQLRLAALLSSTGVESDDDEHRMQRCAEAADEEEYSPHVNRGSSAKKAKTTARRDKGKGEALPPSLRRRRVSATARLAVANSTPLRSSTRIDSSTDETKTDIEQSATAAGAAPSSSSSSDHRSGARASASTGSQKGKKNSNASPRLFGLCFVRVGGLV